MSEIITPIVYQLGLGAVGGFIVGFVLKKIAKLFVFVIGLVIAALLYLGVISINFDALWRAIASGLGLAGEAVSWLVGLISLIPFIGSFMVGFLLGLKLG